MRVGTLGAYWSPDDRRAWSGLPFAVIEELRRLGVYGGHRDASMSRPLLRLVHRWASLTRRTEGWLRRPEMRRLVANYRDVTGLRFANAAIAAEAGTATMYTVERREGDPEWVEAIASLDREVVLRHGYALPHRMTV